LAPVSLNMICFRFNPGNKDPEALNQLNESILKRVNAGGKIYLTHTKINGKYTIRLVAGQTHTLKRHLDLAWDLLQEAAETAMKHD
jgi:aromatic-L-amino-acid decarboxylase